MNGKPLVEDDRIVFGSDGSTRSLKIKDISTKDQGEYQFVVDGTDGKQPDALTASLKAYSVTVQKSKGNLSLHRLPRVAATL